MVEDKGFIKLNRKFFDNHFWKEERIYSLAEAWIDLIQSARFEVAPEKVIVKMKTITINRGELRASQRYLSQKWKWSLGKVNRFIQLLECENMILRRNEHSETIIKLLKYDVFNGFENDKMNTNENTDGTLTEHRQIQTKERKERKERKECVGSKFLPPTLSDVVCYFQEKGYSEESAKKAFDYYHAGNWTDSKGNQVKNWKQKMISVWMKPENKVSEKEKPKLNPSIFDKKY